MIKKLIPESILKKVRPAIQWCFSMLGGLIYGFPSKSLKVIGVTGTKGKSTTVYMITKILEEQGESVAAIGSLGSKIKDREWPNTLKMTMPGRMKLQKFLWQAKKAGCRYVVLEVTSEGLAQQRLAAIRVDCAVFTNLHREHLESHGSFEKYMEAKQELFKQTQNIHVLNMDDPYFKQFSQFPARHKLTYGKEWGMVTSVKFRNQNSDLELKLLGDFNEYNALAALTVADAYRLDLDLAVRSLNAIESIPGRMQIFHSPKGFDVVVDYAHTPDSLEAVYRNLKPRAKKLICVLGAAGGGRDKWKRPEFGKLASEYCDEIILTDEDPFEENSEKILDQVASGISQDKKYSRILDRKEAIMHAMDLATDGDIVVITGKGSEVSMALPGGKKIPWSDAGIVMELAR